MKASGLRGIGNSKGMFCSSFLVPQLFRLGVLGESWKRHLLDFKPKSTVEIVVIGDQLTNLNFDHLKENESRVRRLASMFVHHILDHRVHRGNTRRAAILAVPSDQPKKKSRQ
jgi:hypothetical protein